MWDYINTGDSTMNIYRKSLLVIVCLTIIFDLYFAFWMFFNTHWLEIFYKNSESNIDYVHSWYIGDTIGVFLIIIVSCGIYWLAYKTWFPKIKPVDLKVLRISITGITGFIVIYDIIFIYHILFYNTWPTSEMLAELVDFPIAVYWVGEILILVILIAFQVGLGYLTYKTWFLKSHQPQTL